jgi:hypothetical protein
LVSGTSRVPLVWFPLSDDRYVPGAGSQRPQHTHDLTISFRKKPSQLPSKKGPSLLVVAREPRCSSELADEREQRAVLVIGRAKIAQADMRLGVEALLQRRGDARLAGGRVRTPENQHDLAVPRLARAQRRSRRSIPRRGRPAGSAPIPRSASSRLSTIRGREPRKPRKCYRRRSRSYRLSVGACRRCGRGPRPHARRSAQGQVGGLRRLGTRGSNPT